MCFGVAVDAFACFPCTPQVRKNSIKEVLSYVKSRRGSSWEMDALLVSLCSLFSFHYVRTAELNYEVRGLSEAARIIHPHIPLGTHLICL